MCTSACPGPRGLASGGCAAARSGHSATSLRGAPVATSPPPPRSAQPKDVSAAHPRAKPSVECDVIPLTTAAARGITSHSTLKGEEHRLVRQAAVARDEPLADDPPAHPLVEPERAGPRVGPQHRRTTGPGRRDALGEHEPTDTAALPRRVDRHAAQPPGTRLRGRKVVAGPRLREHG